MSSTATTTIYYGYDRSPFVDKLESMLLLKNIPASRVCVASSPPRPELATLLGILYRRVPVLALGRDVFVDTALIAPVLEKHFPAPQYPSLFPPRKGSEAGCRDIGVQKALSRFYADKELFNLGYDLLPWARTPVAVREDRRKFMHRDVDFDFEQMEEQWPVKHSTLVSHLALCEEQLHDGQDWFLNTQTPGLTDVSIHFALACIRSFRESRHIFDAAQFPRTIAWLDRMDAHLRSLREISPLTKLSGTVAAKIILSSSFLDISDVGFDEADAKRLGLKRGAWISANPDDTGVDALTFGTLVAMNREEVVLETRAQGGGPASVRVHFPKLGFVFEEESALSSKL
ncbi:hypothetical protein K439DRAFT_1407840 [Ramaria rubella]|nr:hypothetical protein K439DRAFT_1407840 [Ramaria rubella]